MIILKRIIFLLLLLNCTTVFAQDSISKMTEDANNAYVEGKFNLSIDIYKKIISAGYESAALYYNLGNAYFKMKDMASAILYYEKSLKLKPDDENTDFNLKVAQTRIIDKIDEIPPPFYIRVWRNMYQIFNSETWGIIIIIFIFLTFLFTAIYLLARHILIRKISFWFGVIFLFATLLSNALAYSQYIQHKYTLEAIVVEPTVHVKSSPDENSTDIFVIHEGTKVQISDKIGKWNLIRIANGSVGWVNVSVMKEI